jgi:competence protein ComEA
MTEPRDPTPPAAVGGAGRVPWTGPDVDEPGGIRAVAARLRAWWVPTPAELVGLALLLLGALVASVLWWYPSVTGPGGVRATAVPPAVSAPDPAIGADGQVPGSPSGADPGEVVGDGAAAAPGPVRSEAHDPGVDARAGAGTDPGASASVTVHVTGGVVTAGLQTLPGGARVADAVAAAGGVATDADLERINLARPLVDGEHVHVPRVGEDLPPVPAAEGTGAVGADGLLDLTRASATDLETLPGIGPSRAAAIVEHREREGPFAVPGDLRAVPGIGEATFQTLAPLVVVR